MQLNVTTDYAIRIVLYLAIAGSTVTSKEIAKVMGIPLYYLYKITNKLTAMGIIECRQGVNGGFKLKKQTQYITIYDIINALEPTTRLNRCLEEDKYCSRFATDNCPVRNFYAQLQKEFDSKLQNLTVKALLGK